MHFLSDLIHFWVIILFYYITMNIYQFLYLFWQKGLDVQFREAECLQIDAVNKKVHCRSSPDNNLGGEQNFTVDYDYLVIAMGARSNTFNTPGVEENCHFLKVC